MPCSPIGPSGPVAPDAPVAPVTPTAPTGPVGPDGPVGPIGPATTVVTGTGGEHIGSTSQQPVAPVQQDMAHGSNEEDGAANWCVRLDLNQQSLGCDPNDEPVASTTRRVYHSATHAPKFSLLSRAKEILG